MKKTIIFYILIILVLIYFNGCNKILKKESTETQLRNLNQKKITNIRYSNIELKYLKLGLVDVQTLDPSIKVDLKYSTNDNFLGKDVYGDLNKCFLQKEVAIKLALAQKYLKEINPSYSLIVYDGLRPRSVQKIMWELVKGTEKQKYVANPERGSIHNYGCAVDLSIIDENGNILDMGTKFDYFGKLAQPRYEDYFFKLGKLSKIQLENRKLLRHVMIKAGFYPISVEWWHFNGLKPEIARKKYKIVE